MGTPSGFGLIYVIFRGGGVGTDGLRIVDERGGPPT